MWRSKKFIIGAVLATVLLAGSIGGIALAADNGDESCHRAKSGELLERVCEIYNANPDRTGDIDCDELEAAFAGVRGEMRAEMQNRLQNLVNEGEITQEQADAMQEWHQARPDVPFEFGFKGHGGFHSMGEMRGFGGPCALEE